jgi:pyruvate/2-oxoglutarate dehydrogenase complex dihydrolipoamide dehydrogenase (E3) component
MCISTITKRAERNSFSAPAASLAPRRWKSRCATERFVNTRAALQLVPGLVEAQLLTHIEALELDEVPEHLFVTGGGYIGLEFSQAMRRFGSKVTIIDRNDRLMHREDDDVTEALQKLFEDEGIDIVLNATIKRISGKSGQSVRIVIELMDLRLFFHSGGQ